MAAPGINQIRAGRSTWRAEAAERQRGGVLRALGAAAVLGVAAGHHAAERGREGGAGCTCAAVPRLVVGHGCARIGTDRLTTPPPPGERFVCQGRLVTRTRPAENPRPTPWRSGWGRYGPKR